MKSLPPRVQYAALPYRRDADGEVEILLVTSLHTRRWIIPKGWPMPDKPAHKAAAHEALEEAGITGIVCARPLGSYGYRKRLKNGARIECAVEVYPLRVTGRIARWPDEGRRMLGWFSPARAAQLVEEPLLKAMILTAPAWAGEGRARPPRNKIWVAELQRLFEGMFAGTPSDAPARSRPRPEKAGASPSPLRAA